MTNTTEIEIAEYEHFPLRPTKEQLKELRKRADIDPNLKGMEAIRAFHEKHNVPFDEENYKQIFKNSTFK